MESLVDCFNLPAHCVVTVVGSGGKSSLIHYLSSCFPMEKVLVSTTTKIKYPDNGTYDFLYTNDYSSLGTEGKGVTIAGNILCEGQKLGMPSFKEFRSRFFKFDKVFLEADGSKSLPLKGWNEMEPVVLPETTHTIGVIPFSVLGKPATEQFIHRLPLFLEMTGWQEGKIIDRECLTRVVLDKRGLWKAALGERILFFNQVETKEQVIEVNRLSKEISDEMLGNGNNKVRIVAGSVWLREGVVL